MAGLKMYGTASRSKHDVVSSFGGIPMDYRTEDLVERLRTEVGGVDAVFDPVGGSNWRRSDRALRRGGRLIGYGMSAAIAGGRRNVPLAAATLAMLGGLRLPVVAERLPLRSAARAHELLESRTGASGPRRHVDQKLVPYFGPSRPLCGVFLRSVGRSKDRR